MTTQITFGNRDAESLEVKIASRDTSIDSIRDDQQQVIDEFTKRTNDLTSTLSTINNAFIRCTRQVTVIQWATRQLVLYMQELCESQYVIERVKHTGKNKKGQSYTYYTNTIHWPWAEIYKSLYNKYKFELERAQA